MADRLRLTAYAPHARAVLRIVSGLLFLEHGTQKFFGFPAGERAGIGWAFDSPSAFSGAIEVVAGVLIVVGLFTRSAAFISSGTMAVAYWTVHAPKTFFPVNNTGDSSILFCFVFLYLVFSGPGAWSVDGGRLRKRVRLG